MNLKDIEVREDRALTNVKALGKAPLVEWYGPYIIMAQSEHDLKVKQNAIRRGDTDGFYTLERALALQPASTR